MVELTKFPDDTQNSFVLADAVVSREADGGDERLHLCVIRENEQLRVQIAEVSELLMLRSVLFEQLSVSVNGVLHCDYRG